MKHLNFAIDDKTHERKKALHTTWYQLIKLGLETFSTQKEDNIRINELQNQIIHLQRNIGKMQERLIGTYNIATKDQGLAKLEEKKSV